jgi:hypothetical protein
VIRTRPQLLTEIEKRSAHVLLSWISAIQANGLISEIGLQLFRVHDKTDHRRTRNPVMEFCGFHLEGKIYCTLFFLAQYIPGATIKTQWFLILL